jgi:hypothetical protein
LHVAPEIARPWGPGFRLPGKTEPLMPYTRKPAWLRAFCQSGRRDLCEAGEEVELPSRTKDLLPSSQMRDTEQAVPAKKPIRLRQALAHSPSCAQPSSRQLRENAGHNDTMRR